LHLCIVLHVSLTLILYDGSTDNTNRLETTMPSLKTIALIAAAFLATGFAAHAGVLCQTTGNETNCSDGSITQTIGNTTYTYTPGGHGLPARRATICQTIGNQTVCN
jgi:hypothetical protein